jgi:hypothetical protein
MITIQISSAILMKTMRTFLEFENGKILSTGKYELGVSVDATTIESLKFFLNYWLSTNQFSGTFYIGSSGEKICLKYGDAKPKKYIKLLIAELRGRFSIREGD